MPESAAAETLAVRRRRECHPEKFAEQSELAAGCCQAGRPGVVRHLLPVGAKWRRVGTAAGLAALHRSGVTFRRKWRPPKLNVWRDRSTRRSVYRCRRK
jgi:hypothetical protein